MQNIYAILAKYSLTVPEDKKAEFEEALNANYKTVAEVEKITTARDNYNKQNLHPQSDVQKSFSISEFLFTSFSGQCPIVLFFSITLSVSFISKQALSHLLNVLPSTVMFL